MEGITTLKARPALLSTIAHRYSYTESGNIMEGWWMDRKPVELKATFWKAVIQILCKLLILPIFLGQYKYWQSPSKSLLKSLGTHVKEHYPNASYGVYPIENDSKVAILIVANKYSPNNFWWASCSLPSSSSTNQTRNGRWRSLYIYDPSTSSLTGSLKVDVHYYEDGNVRLLTNKPISASISSGSATTIVREITVAEKKYQEELNKGFNNLSEGAFKGLRRQLPITRQKIEWDKIAGYRLGQDIGGGSSRR